MTTVDWILAICGIIGVVASFAGSYAGVRVAVAQAKAIAIEAKDSATRAHERIDTALLDFRRAKS